MNKKFLVLIGFMVFIFCGSVLQNAHALEQLINTQKTASVSLFIDAVQVADNVVILFDTSSSMGKSYKDSGMTKLQAAKKLLQRQAKLFPDVFPKLNVGLYSYASSGRIFKNLKGYKVYYKMQSFKKDSFLNAVEQLPDKAKGATLLQNALLELDDLLKTLSGHTVVFLFSDGNYSKSSGVEKPIALAKKLADKYDVSFQIISSTDQENQKKIIDTVASINESSRVHSFENFLDRPYFYTGAIFVLQKSLIVSTGTYDKVVGYKLDDILFGFDKSDFQSEFTEELDAAGKILQKNPESYFLISGFTDSHGTEEYNRTLSHQRANEVANYMAQKFQINNNRILRLWYGEKAPIGDNNTATGRQQNRRVQSYIVFTD
jgi:OOP family OmpA-OmpF porin